MSAYAAMFSENPSSCRLSAMMQSKSRMPNTSTYVPGPQEIIRHVAREGQGLPAGMNYLPEWVASKTKADSGSEENFTRR
ncbi:hypothetical protein H4Q26_008405 [Puccinia striiformis f. sp. tritici PST-130]|nr:hypothetical protein H4Q26_008405 [Puccinia striiformis f. sp. tritici PST-130]